MRPGLTCGLAGWPRLVLCVFVLALPAAAQFGATGVVSTTTVKVDGITCTTPLGANIFAVNSWKWEMQQLSSGASSTGGRVGAGRVVASDVSLTKSFDACSTALALASARGVHLRRVDITQYDKNSNILISVRLDDVSISSYKANATATQANPGEELTLHFRTIRTTQSRGGFGWDFAANRQL